MSFQQHYSNRIAYHTYVLICLHVTTDCSLCAGVTGNGHELLQITVGYILNRKQRTISAPDFLNGKTELV
jgi:lantibiotic modifying enzyme